MIFALTVKRLTQLPPKQPAEFRV